jgi:hypothetical protein
MLKGHGLDIIEFASPKPNLESLCHRTLADLRPEFSGTSRWYTSEVGW